MALLVQPHATEAGLRFGEIAPVFRRMATPLRSRSNRVGAKSFGVTVKRVSPKVFAPGGNSGLKPPPKKDA